MGRSPRPEPPRLASAPMSREEIMKLIDVAALLASAAPRALDPHLVQLNELGVTASDPSLDPAVVVMDEVMARLERAWENGWQPLDLVHATRRHTSKAVARWITGAVLLEADRSGAPRRAPRPWTDQLHALAPKIGAATTEQMLPSGGGAGSAQWTTALAGLGMLQRLPRVQLLAPPPSRWDVARTEAPVSPGQSEKRTKMLAKVRALLAKAESTEFEGEAEALTAKAQDLMTRYSIDEALLAADLGPDVHVRGVRVLIHHPYAVEKAGLLDVVARANRVRTVWSSFSSCATLVGLPIDVEQVEMLFTSTLVQATRAMTHAGESSGGLDRSSTFRKAFLSAYAHRIGERLTASSEMAAATYGNGLVPVFERQAEAIDGEVDRLFPRLETSSRRSYFDARGWHAGTRAADAAVLPAGAVES